MNQILIATILLTVLWGCNHTTDKINSTLTDEMGELTNNDFEKYISTLDQITLPLEHNPLGQLPDLSRNYDKDGFENFKHIWTSKPLGILYKDEKTIGIIESSIGDWGLVPFLITYDLNGNKIDSTGFYNKSGQDIGYEAIEYLTFNANRTITVIDTIKSWDLNQNESDTVEGSMKISTGKVEYQVLENGQIKKK